MPVHVASRHGATCRPEGIVDSIPFFAIIESPVENGELCLGATQLLLDYCQFNQDWRKRTHF